MSSVSDSAWADPSILEPTTALTDTLTDSLDRPTTTDIPSVIATTATPLTPAADTPPTPSGCLS